MDVAHKLAADTPMGPAIFGGNEASEFDSQALTTRLCANCRRVMSYICLRHVKDSVADGLICDPAGSSRMSRGWMAALRWSGCEDAVRRCLCMHSLVICERGGGCFDSQGTLAAGLSGVGRGGSRQRRVLQMENKIHAEYVHICPACLLTSKELVLAWRGVGWGCSQTSSVRPTLCLAQC